MDNTTADLSSVSDSCWDDDGQKLTSDEPSLDAYTPVIFGREREKQLMLETFQKVVATREAATIVVHGESGSGKTSLVDTLRVPAIKEGGYFCAGKFFQNSALQEPYSAIMAAFSDICDMVTQADDFNAERQRKIRKAMGTDGHMLKSVISNISPLVCDIPDSTDGAFQIANENYFAKFKVACKTFIQAVSSDEHPLVLFIDDIQWMDVGSRLLLELFLSDKQMRNVLLILVYREEETEKVSNLLLKSHQVLDIHLTNLDASAIYEIICATTSSQSEQFRELSVLTEKRTGGNPFHVREFLAMIQTEGLLTYDNVADAWTFDIDEIRSSVMMHNGLAALLKRKIEQVGESIRETLKIASMIGYDFDETLVLASANVILTGEYESSDTAESIASSRTMESLNAAIVIGFIEKKTSGGFQFTHDTIQMSFQEMIRTNEEIERTHDIIGQTILYLGDANDDATMYQAVVHFNAAADRMIVREGDVYPLVQMNYRAAKHCISKSGFQTASSLLQFGLELMDSSQRWSDRFFTLSFEMTELLAKAELVIGHFENCKKAISEAILHAKSTEMEITSLLLDLEARVANHELDQFILSSNRALLALGVKMPKRVASRHVSFKYMQVKFMLRKKSDNYLLSLPNVANPLISTAITVLTNLCAQCLMVDDEDQAIYAALKACVLSLKFGLSSSSPTAFVFWGVAEAAVHNYDEAYRFGKLALRMLERVGSTTSVTPTVGYALTLLTYRKERLDGLKHELLKAGTIGFMTGDIVHATYCTAHAMAMDGSLSSNLIDCEDSLRSAMYQTSELGQDAMLLWYKPTLQYVLNLQSHPVGWDSVMVLSGEAMCEDDFILAARKANHTVLVAIALIYKSILAASFRFFKEASEICVDIEKMGKAARMSYGQISFIWCAAYSNFELYRIAKKRKQLRRARYYRKGLGDLVAFGCPEAAIWYDVLLTVELSLKTSVTKEELIKVYNESISKMADEARYHMEASMNEHAGFYLVRCGCISEAAVYFDRALHVYQHQWCSNAQYQWLLEKTEKYLQSTGECTLSPHIGDFIVCDLDDASS